MTELLLLDCYPDALAFVLGLDDFLFQAVEPDARVEHLAHFPVLAYEDAALGILGGVARVDADALELRHTEQDWQPLLHLRRVRDDHCIAAFGDGTLTLDLIGPVFVVAPGGFQCVTKILVLRSCQILVVYTSLNIEVTNRVGLAFCYTF